jgi:hypothetical protein
MDEKQVQVALLRASAPALLTPMAASTRELVLIPPLGG